MKSDTKKMPVEGLHFSTSLILLRDSYFFWELGTDFYKVHLRFSKRRKAPMLRLSFQGYLELHLPESYPSEDIVMLLERKKVWVMKKLKTYRDVLLQQKKNNFTRDGWVYILGQRHYIVVKRGLRQHCLIKDQQLYVYYTRSLTETKLKDTLIQFLISHAKEKFLQILEECRGAFPKKLPDIQLTIRKMNNSWGNMRLDGKMALSLKLIHCPEECIASVIMHELCHLYHFDHSKNFYSLLTSVFPSWKSCEDILRLYQNIHYRSR